MFDGRGSLPHGVVPGGRGRRLFWRHAAAQEAAPGVRRGELSGYLGILVCSGPGATRGTSGRGPWGRLAPDAIIVAMPAQALHAIEQLVVVALGFAGCPSAAAAPLCFRLTCDRHNQSDLFLFLCFLMRFLLLFVPPHGGERTF